MANRMTPRALILTLAFVVGCEKETRAEVRCVPANDGITCTVTHTQGSRRANVCWEAVIPCQNGSEAVGRACQLVEPQGSAIRIIPEAAMTGLQTCGQGVGFSVRNLVITQQ